jgi:methanogenic corrinoid protein MtbC1
MEIVLKTISPAGLQRYCALEAEAASAVVDRFFPAQDAAPEQSELRATCRQYLAFHLEFLKPVLQFGLLGPMVEYLRWLSDVCAARNIPRDQLVRSLDWLGEYFTARMDVADGAAISAALNAARHKFMAPDDAAVAAAAPLAPWPELEAMQDALIAGNHRAALDIVNDCFESGRNLIEIEAQLLKPAMYHIGDKWQANEVSIAQEHVATAIVEMAMSMALLRSPPPAANGYKVLLACVAGNQHALGLRMVADAFQLAGWDIQYLGADVPTAAVVQHVVQFKPDLIGLGLSFGPQLVVVKSLIAQLNARLGPSRPPVIVGGLAINQFDRIADMVGADGSGPDAQAAVVEGNRLLNPEDNGCCGLRAS